MVSGDKALPPNHHLSSEICTNKNQDSLPLFAGIRHAGGLFTEMKQSKSRIGPS